MERERQKTRPGSQGFTLVELVIVMAVISLILSVVLPNLRGMQQEGQLTKAEAELDTLKTAITSYWRNNGNAYPANITNALTGATPTIITQVLTDPFKTDAVNSTYGYISGTDATFGDYFIVYTKGPKGNTSPTWSAATQTVTYSGGGRVVSNAPVVKQ
jgi:prepilin-type N-terminal cleavage/methylation domain-containing protein